MSADTLRLGVLTCPQWPIVAAGADPHDAVVVLRANRVVVRSSLAAHHGVEVGMRRRQAQTRSPSVHLLADDPERDARAFEAVVGAVGEMIPRVEVGAPGTLTFVARGPARYFGGEVAMAQRLGDLAARCLAPRSPIFGVGIADGRFAAELAARRACQRHQPVIVEAGRQATAAFLAPLPIRVLHTVGELPDDLVQLFVRLGLNELGQLAALPPSAVLGRFGQFGACAHALARGDDPRRPACTDPPQGKGVQHAFDTPVLHADALLFTMRRPVETMTAALAASGCISTRVEIVVETEHGERSERHWYRSDGLTAAAVIERLRWQLDAWVAAETLTAGITLVRVEPLEVRADDGEQQRLWGGRRAEDEWAGRATARLATMVGEQLVLVPHAHAGRLPDELHRWVPATTVDLFDATARLAGVTGPWPGRAPIPQPTVVHRPPLPLDVVDAEGHPITVTGRGMVSAAPAAIAIARRRHAVDNWAGPWPVEQRWWDRRGTRRVARFQLQAGPRLFEVVVERGRWWLIGEHA